jgi:predicted acetyltransferase
MIAEFREHDDVGLYTGFYETAWVSFEAYKATLEQLSKGGWPFPEVVPGETLFLMDNDLLIGEFYLRFGLTDVLEKDGGNIGYHIRPTARGKGYATAGVRLALEHLERAGLTKALATCSETNAASIRVLEKVGALRDNDVKLDDGPINRRYLIHVR